MSYPRSMQVLIVEDEQQAKQYYETVLAKMKETEQVSSVQYAFSYNEGIKALDQKAMFHLVILDLRLPEDPGLPPADGTDYGLALLRKCENRDDYPVPAL